MKLLRRIDPADVLIEVFSIVLAILVSEREHHRAVYNAFKALSAHEHVITLDEFFGTFSKANPTGFHPFEGESFAWDVMRSSPAVNAVPYDTRILLERTYAEQTLLVNENAQILSALEVNDTARDPDYYAATLSMYFDLGDIVYSQAKLEGLYDTALRDIH
jgi:hypothetical protein